jgi:HPt (histidine-containing phosphotransfer) domain-containing protein
MGSMDLIDIALTREQFDAFDAEVVAMLCEATQADLQQWSGRLRLAWEQEDQDGVARARHALKGVCGNYGAAALMALAEGPILAPAAGDSLSACVEETIAAIRAVAQGSAQ